MELTALLNDETLAPRDGARAHVEGFTLEDNPFLGAAFDDEAAAEWARDWECRHRFAVDNDLQAEVTRVETLQYLRDSRIRWT